MSSAHEKDLQLAVAELNVLTKNVAVCKDDIHDLTSLANQEADLQTVLNLNQDVARQLQGLHLQYQKALRKQIAGEAHKLQTMLHILKKFEPKEDWKELKHGQLAEAVLEYNQFHNGKIYGGTQINSRR
eukprot:Trichotokara_eunicae@DN3321_c0_g1_i2.p1